MESLKNEDVKIIIKDNFYETVLITDGKNFVKDLELNKDKILEMWWTIYVEYEHESTFWKYLRGCAFEYKMIDINGRPVFAKWNLGIDDGKATIKDFNRLVEFIKQDFETVEINPVIEKHYKEYNKYMRQTQSPENKNIKAEKVEVLAELKDE